MSLLRTTILLALATTLAATGCSSYSDTEEEGTITYTTFDERLPEAMEEVFAECQDPLAINPGMSDVDLTGGCLATDVSTPEAQLLIGLIAVAGDLELDEPVPHEVDHFETVVDGLSWPVQNCAITIDGPIDFEGMDLYDLDARWKKIDGEPNLKIDFDFNGTQTVASVDLDADVDCPSGVSQWLINTFASGTLNAIEGNHNVKASSMDLDIAIAFDHTETEITAEMDLTFSVGDLTLVADWSKLGKYVDRNDVEEDARKQLEDEGQAVLEDALASLADTAADLLMDAVPDDHIICKISIVNGDHLELKTAEDTGSFPCFTITFQQQTFSNPFGVQKP